MSAPSKAEELLRSGQPAEALAALQKEVRAQPARAELRVFLFQLLTVLGEWDRALTQLRVSGELEPKALPMVKLYETALRLEVLRAQVFAGERAPLVFGEPPEWIAFMLEALRLEATGAGEEAAALRERALETADAVPGTLAGEPFAWLADADSRLGPVLELFVQGRYYWAPLERIARVSVEEPTDLRDFVWAPAQLTFANGGETVALIPARYPGTERSEDSALLLGRKTEWVERAGGSYHGLGQRMLATDTGERALLDAREIVLETAEQAGEA